MSDPLVCEYVVSVYPGKIEIASTDKPEFINQYRAALKETKGTYGVVYILKTGRVIPRFKGESNILYIGKTKNDVWSRYNVEKDTGEFWSDPTPL